MSPEMREALNKAITDNLPGTTAGALKEFIEEAERLKQKHEKLQGSYDLLVQNNRELGEKIRDLEAMRDEYKKAANMLEDVAKRELELAHATARNIAAVAQAELQGYKDVTALVFRNESVNTLVTRSVAVPVEGMRPSPQGNGYSSPGTAGVVMNATESESTHVTKS